MCFCVLFRFLIKDTVQSTWRHLEEDLRELLWSAWHRRRTPLHREHGEGDETPSRRFEHWRHFPTWKSEFALKTRFCGKDISSTFPTGAKIQVLLTCEWSGSLTMRFSVSLHVDKKLLVRIWSLFVGTFFFVQARNLLVHCQEIGGWFDWFIDVTFKNWKAWEGDRPLKSFEHFEPYWGDWVTQLSEKNPQATNPVDSCFRSPAVRVAKPVRLFHFDWSVLEFRDFPRCEICSSSWSRDIMCSS